MGVLIINADDWGIDRHTTDRTHECIRCGTVSSVSAMVFMEDSERAAALARENAIDAGLHLNLSAAFTAKGVARPLADHQERVIRHLRRHRFAQVLPHPGLATSFDYVVKAQLEEFARLFGRGPERIDGHHHMHLCANVVFGELLPRGAVVRRNFSFQAGEKGFANRWYRGLIDGRLGRRHQLLDYFFNLSPIAPPARLERIFSLARESTVEVETHPVLAEEHRFLTSSEVRARLGDVRIATRFAAVRGEPGRWREAAQSS
jgi:chitin disaccharide deacetylase